MRGAQEIAVVGLLFRRAAEDVVGFAYGYEAGGGGFVVGVEVGVVGFGELVELSVLDCGLEWEGIGSGVSYFLISPAEAVTGRSSVA